MIRTLAYALLVLTAIAAVEGDPARILIFGAFPAVYAGWCGIKILGGLQK